MTTICIDGVFVEAGVAHLSPLDLGFTHGLGVFETIRAERAHPLFHGLHHARLARGARLLEIPFAMSNEELLTLCHQVLDANGWREARLRVTLSAGPAKGAVGEGHPTLVISGAPLEPGARQAAPAQVDVVLSRLARNHHSPLSTVKHTSYAESHLARREATSRGAFEALLLNTDGLVAEGSCTNVFCVSAGRVLTPPVEDGALPGVMRHRIGLLCARLGIGYEETSLTLEELRNSSEVFLTNAILQVARVRSLDGIPLGETGETTRLFAEHRRQVGELLDSLEG